MKRAFLCIALVITVILLPSCKPSVLSSLPSYSASDEYLDDAVTGGTDFCKYYYNDNFDAEKWNDNKYLKPVTSGDMDEILSYCEDFEKASADKDWYGVYDLKTEGMEESDYFYIYTEDGNDKFKEYYVFYFDTSITTLYYLHHCA